MTVDEIIKIYANGDVNRAMKESEVLYPELYQRIKSSLSHVTDIDIFVDHYKRDNDRIPGAQITGGWLADERQQEALRQVLALHGSCLLDIGCADGSFCFFNLEQFNVLRVIGVDLWENGIIWAKKHGEKYPSQTMFLQGAYEQVSIPPVYDIVHIGEVLEHVQDPIKVLKKAISETTALKGIVITVPTDRPPVSVDEKNKMFVRMEHVRLIDLPVIESYCTEIGFMIQKSVSVGAGWKTLVATIVKK